MKHPSEVVWAQFSPDGQRIVTAFTTPFIVTVPTVQFSTAGQSVLTASCAAQLWDVQTGRSLTPPLQRSPDRAQPLFPGDSAGRLWDLAFIPSTLPDWLLPLAEVLSGKRLDKQGRLEQTQLDRAEALRRMRSELAKRPSSDPGIIWGRSLLNQPRALTAGAPPPHEP
jgi:hypothetical protein